MHYRLTAKPIRIPKKTNKSRHVNTKPEFQIKHKIMMDEFWQDPLKNDFIPQDVQRRLMHSELRMSPNQSFIGNPELDESVDKYDVEQNIITNL